VRLDEYADQLVAKIEAAAGNTETTSWYTSAGIVLTERAPNAVQWIVGERYLNIPTLWKNPRQYQLVRDYFQLLCPICNPASCADCWGKTPEQLQREVLLVWDEQAQEDRCPRCHSLRSELEEEGLLRRYDAMVGCAGMRSGKSVLAAMIGSYMRHILIVLGIRSRGLLHRLLGLLASQHLEIAFVATTQTQSNQTIWANFKLQCASSPWFQAYVAWVKQREAEQQTPKGMRRWEYKELEESIEDGWLLLNCMSLNSNSSGMAGRTRPAFFIDELSRFGLGESKLSADEVWAVFENSLQTIRGARRELGKVGWLGSAIAISSPISIEDKTMRLLEVAKRVETMFGWRYATWDFNPRLPRESFAANFAADPVIADRDFGANPPNAASPLIADPLRYWAAIDATAKPSATFEIESFTDKSGHDYLSARLTWAATSGDRPLYLFADTGKTFDQFALVACSGLWLPGHERVGQADVQQAREAHHLGGYYPQPNEHTMGGQYVDGPPAWLTQAVSGPPPVGPGGMVHGGHGDEAPEGQLTLVTYHEWTLRILPERNRPVWFEAVVEILVELVKHRKVAMFGCDHWNSESTLQKLSNMGVPTQLVSLKVDDFSRMVQDALVGRLRLQPPHPDDQLSIDERGTLRLGRPPPEMTGEGLTLYEMLRLERSKDLTMVFNPRKGLVRGWDSDDTARCLVGAHRLVQESAGRTRRDDRKIDARGRETAFGGQFQGRIVRPPRIR
jgi:hypothetical protein